MEEVADLRGFIADFRRKSFLKRNVCTYGLFLAVVLVAALSGIILSQGIQMNSDGWAFWSGSVSLMEGAGYVHFYRDAAILEWPPLYSLYLASWQLLFGVSGQTLIYSTIFLAALATGLWGWFFLRVINLFSLPGRRRLFVYSAVLLYLALFIPYYYKSLLIDNLRFALLPVYLYYLLDLLREDRTKYRRGVWGLTLMGVLLVSIHNANLAFVFAAGVMLPFILRPRAVAVKATLAVVGIPFAAWFALRLWLSLQASHAFNFTVRFDFLWLLVMKTVEDTAMLLYGPVQIQGYLLIPAVLFAVWVIMRFRKLERSDGRSIERHPLMMIIIYVGVALLLNMLLCHFVQISVRSRFIWFLPLLVVPFLLILSARINVRVLFPSAIVVFLLPALLKYLLLVFVVFAHWGSTPQPVEIFVRPEMYIQRGYTEGEPKVTSKGTLVAPPLYEWIKDRVE